MPNLEHKRRTFVPRLFVSNFDFENHLSGRPDPRAEIGAQQLAHVWNSIAHDGDRMFSPTSAVEHGSVDEAGEITTLHSPSEVYAWQTACDEPIEAVPWGWDKNARRIFAQCEVPFLAPADEIVRLANNRKFSCECESEFNPNQDWVCSISSVEEFVQRVKELAARGEYNWILKPEFSFAGRDCLRSNHSPKSTHQTTAQLSAASTIVSDNQTNWVRRRLKTSSVLFLERHLNAQEEVGLQFQIPHSDAGEPSFMGMVQSLVAPNGAWIGCAFCSDAHVHSKWQQAVEIGMCVAKRLQTAGYFGPLGIDAMEFLDAQHERIRPIQDINARWSMGRLALGWRRRLKPNQHAVWWHLRHQRSANSSQEICELLQTHFKNLQVHATSTRAATIPSKAGCLDTFLLVTDKSQSLPNADQLWRCRL